MKPQVRVSVYVVFGRHFKAVNNRVEHLGSLSSDSADYYLLTPGRKKLAPFHEPIIALPNIKRLLTKMGLKAFVPIVVQFMVDAKAPFMFSFFAKRKLARLISKDLKEGRRVTLVTCFPPHSLGSVGVYLKAKFKDIRWILDWQDLWTHDENYINIIPPRLMGHARELEKSYFLNGDVHVTTNDYAKRVLEDKYNVPENKVVAVCHPYELDKIDDPKKFLSDFFSYVPGEKIRFGFMGALFKPPRVPGKELVKAIVNLRKKYPQLELHVYGLPPASGDIESAIPANTLFFHEAVPHYQAINLMTKYDFLLVLLADLENSKIVMSIKLPHYMVAGPPIIGIVPSDSFCEKFIMSTGAGFVVPVDSSWEQGMDKIIATYIKSGIKLIRNREVIEGYSLESFLKVWRKLCES